MCVVLYHLEFRCYQRPFTPPLLTAHGQWATRQGLILRLVDQTGRVGFGEIAPLPEFGSETLEQAVDFCQQLPQPLTAARILAIPAEFRACQFGLESAWESLTQPGFALTPLAYCGLLPTGAAALDRWPDLWQQGYRTFKWKIGREAIASELEIFQRLVEAFPPQACLRLDANAGLELNSARQWLQVCDRHGIELLEQPLSGSEFEAMLGLSQDFSTPLALDESVATLDQLQACYDRGWRGIFVIKPAIAGSPRQLRQFCQTHAIDALFSSVFETAIGRRMGLQLAQELTAKPRAVGFGVDHWFQDPLTQWPATDFQNLWQQL